MKVIKIVIDDEEEKALSPEAEELLRRRAAEVGFSTLDWIVSDWNSTRSKTTKTNRKTRTRRDFLMDRGWPDFTFEVLLQRQAHARSTCSSWRIWKTPPAASTLGRRKRTHRTSTDDRVPRRRPTHCRKNRPRPLALIDPEPRRCLPSGFFEVRWSGSAAETICCRAAPVRGSGRDARRCGRRLRRNRDRPSGTSAHRGHRKPPRREWADREINPPKNPGQQSGISVGCRRSGKALVELINIGVVALAHEERCDKVAVGQHRPFGASGRPRCVE